ncbi:MAG: hypothetical protein ACLFP4_15905 [Spirochaetales bacterium]
MKRLATILLVTVLAFVSAEALELTRGNLKLELFDRSARFLVSFQTEEGWQPLLFPNDPRTSAIDILEANQVHRMGDSGRFSQRIETTQYGPEFVWESPTLLVRQRFSFIRGRLSTTFDGLEIEVVVENKAEISQELGVRLLYDTYLGEQSGDHFYVSGTQPIAAEQVLPEGAPFVTSSRGSDATFGFQLVLDDSAITKPANVYVANWRRLTESAWDFSINPQRNFNRLPYSINDSAILVVYPSRVVEQGGTYRTVTRIGNLAPEGYVSPAVALETTEGASVNASLLARLATVIDEIAALSLQETIRLEEIRALQNELNAIRELVNDR